jgi:predicted ATPase/class 3 adenylate cyclase/DNA-binding CsgD family transcriptional regulator
MLANMSETSWKNLDMSELPTGTVTLLLADVEGSTRLWEIQPDAMKAAVERLDQTLADAVAAHRGVRPVEQGEGDSFVIAFSRAADAVACALDLQRAPLAPIKLRIGVHTGDVHMRDEGNYIGPTINRTARLRDLAHGGQTVLSGATEPLVVDQLPPDVTLNDLGSHPLRDLPRPERVAQLCHPDLHNDFPPLRTANVVAAENLPVQLSSFIGRKAELRGIREALADNRLVTLTGAGGAGKTRLAIQVAAEVASEFADGVWYVDLAPITDPDVVPVTAARALGLPDQPGKPTMDVLLRFIRDRRMLIVLDNCEHLLDSSAELVIALLGACPALTLLATSREPIGLTGEVSWRVPSLSLADDAIELFSDRARRTKPEFRVSPDNAETVTEICRRLDGLPLAIELAAARVRALSPAEILESLHDQFRMLTGGARTAVRRQQTLRASVDWSHELLSEPEQVLFRRLAVFFGGFDVDAAQAVAVGADAERYQVLDQLTLLVDKSLVVAEDSPHGTRYRLLETVRQYAQEKLHESREGDDVRTRHRDHYTAMAARLDAPADSGYQQRIEWAEAEMANLRAAFAWSLERTDGALAQALASSLHPLWWTRGRLQEGLNWLSSALACDSSPSAEATAARVRAVADKTLFSSFTGSTEVREEAAQALATARELGDPALTVRTLTSCGVLANPHDREAARPLFAEATELARQLGDSRSLAQIIALDWMTGRIAYELVGAQEAAAEGLRIAEDIGYGFLSRQFRYLLGWAQVLRGDLIGCATRLAEVVEESNAANDLAEALAASATRTYALAYLGDVASARALAVENLERASGSGEYNVGIAYAALGTVHLATGDAPAAWAAYEAARERTAMDPMTSGIHTWAPLAPLTCGDVAVARRWADDVVSVTTAWSLAAALTSRSRVLIAQGELDAAERDAYDALELAASLGGDLVVPFALDCLATVAAQSDNHLLAARLFGAADTARHRMSMVRFKILDESDEAAIAALRDALGTNDFDAAWAEGAALSIPEAIAYAQRGRGERKRASSGWASLTRAELDVVKLVSEGLGNKEVAARLFVSPRTVQAHLTHVYTKLGLTSRMQLAQEAAKHGAMPSASP